MIREKILKAAEICYNEPTCDGCPFDLDCEIECAGAFAKYILDKEKELAPAGTGTSPQINILHDNDSTKLKLCQGLAKKILIFEKEFDNASTHEQRENLLCLIAAESMVISKSLLEIRLKEGTSKE